jgi:hypothetical protein
LAGRPERQFLTNVTIGCCFGGQLATCTSQLRVSDRQIAKLLLIRQQRDHPPTYIFGLMQMIAGLRLDQLVTNGADSVSRIRGPVSALCLSNWTAGVVMTMIILLLLLRAMKREMMMSTVMMGAKMRKRAERIWRPPLTAAIIIRVISS